MKRAAGALAALLAVAAHAHDSWFAPSRESAGDRVKLEFATGTRYPVQDLSPGAGSLVSAVCSDPEGQRFDLQPRENNARWLDLEGPAGRAALSCWAELKSFDIELKPEIVKIYLDEIRAPAAIRSAWNGLQASGLPWRESYRKFARIELQPQLAKAREPVGLPMEIVVLGAQAVAAGQPIEFQVLRDGRPLAGFAVEFVSERSRFGVWRETDGEGKLRQALPFAGQWLLRGTDVRPAGDRFVSRFVTLAIEVR